MHVLSPADLGFGRLFEVIREAVIVADAESGQIVLWNPAAEVLFGYPAAEAVGMPLEVLVPDRLKARFRAGLARYRETGRGRLIEAGRPLEVPAVRRDDAERVIELALNSIDNAPVGGLFVLALVRDVTERKEEEQRARHLAAIVESSEDAIIGAREDGTITSWNAGAKRLYGYTAKEMVGQSVTRLVPPDRPDELAGLLVRLRRGKSIKQYETQRLRKDGCRVDVSSTFSPLRDAGGRLVGVAVITRDITERKQSEARLRASEERYRLATRATRDIIWDLNLASGEFAGSEAFRQVFGHAPDEALKTLEGAHRWWLAHVHPDDCERVQADYQAAVEGTGQGWETEYRFWRSDGTYAHVLDRGYIARDEQGRATRMLGALQDITERKRAEEEQARLLDQAEAAETKFRGLLESTPDAMVISDQAGRIVLVNRQTEVVLGYDRDELIGQQVELLVPERFRAAHVEQRAGYLADPRARPMGRGLELFARRKDGSEFPVEISLSPVESEAGLLVITAIRDITERKRVEEERARLYEALADREQQLQDLVGRLILAQENERRRVAYNLHDGLAQTAAGVHLHLRAFARRNRERMPEGREELDQALNLAQRVVREAREVVAELRPTALDDLGLEAALDAEVEELRKAGWQVEYEAALGAGRLAPAVETALFRVAQEALRNARKHSEAKRARVGLRRTRRRVRLEVQDWGRGFDPARLPRGGGPGERVGLSGMRERVALLGGRCDVESHPGEGTRVAVEVPLRVPVGQAAADVV